MKAFLLIPLLALSLAACGDKDNDDTGTSDEDTEDTSQ